LQVRQNLNLAVVRKLLQQPHNHIFIGKFQCSGVLYEFVNQALNYFAQIVKEVRKLLSNHPYENANLLFCLIKVARENLTDAIEFIDYFYIKQFSALI